MTNMSEYDKRRKSELMLPLKERRHNRDTLATFIDAIEVEEVVALRQPVVPGPTGVRNQENLSEAQVIGGASYRRLFHNFVKSSGSYAISSLASPLVSLLLLPFITRMLSRADYGAITILYVLISLLSSVTSMGLDAVFARTYSFECKTRRERLDAISTLSLLLCLIMLPVLVVGVLIAPWLSTFLLSTNAYKTAIYLSVLLVVVQNLTIPGLMWMRVENRSLLYSITSIANCLFVAGATIVLVGILHMGVVGALIATGLGNVIVAACTLPLIFFRAGFYLRFTIVISMLTLGVPYAVNYITMWALQLSDRYLLGHFASLSATASYTVAYSLGGSVALLITKPFSMAWWVFIYPIARREDALQIFKLIFRWYSFLLLFATLGLSLVGVSILDLLFPVSYHGQSMIISVVALSIVFNSIFTIFNLGMTLRRKTWLASVALLFSALLNLGANIVLIPLHGAMGAAIATLIAYIALALVSYLFNQCIYPVPFEVGLFLLALVIGIVLYFADHSLIQEKSNIIIWSIHLSLLLLYGGSLAILSILPGHRRKRY